MGSGVGIDDAIQKGLTRTSHERTKSAAEPSPGVAAEPNPLFQRTPFPLDVYPPRLADFFKNVADAVGVPVDIPATTALAVAGAAVGATRRFKFRPDWHASSTLFVAIVGPSGSGKSPAIRHVLQPLRMAEKFYAQEHAFYAMIYPDVARQRAAAELPEPPLPPREATRLFADDFTMESLIGLHQRNPRSLIAHMEELVQWVASFDAYRGGRGGDRSRWLKIFDGEPITKDRIGGQGYYSVTHPAITLHGGIQPSMLGALADKELREDGLLPRFLYCYPEGVTDSAPYRNVRVSDDRFRHWLDAVLSMLRLNFQAGDPRPVTSATGVEAIYQEWYNKGAVELQAADFPQHLRPVWTKLRVIVLRLALIIHQMRVATGMEDDALTLTKTSMNAACRVADWSKRQAVAVYGTLHEDKAARQIQALLRWMTRRQDKSVTVRQVLQHKVGGVKGAREARAVCAAAMDRGFGVLDADNFTKGTGNGDAT